MSIFKVITYCVTFAAAMFFAFWKNRLKRRLTDAAISSLKLVSDLGIFNDIKEELKREEALRDLPKQQLFKYRVVNLCTFLFFVMLVVEVLVLQK